MYLLLTNTIMLLIDYCFFQFFYDFMVETDYLIIITFNTKQTVYFYSYTENRWNKICNVQFINIILVHNISQTIFFTVTSNIFYFIVPL